MSENPFNDLADNLEQLRVLSEHIGVENEMRQAHAQAVAKFQTCISLLQQAGEHEMHYEMVFEPIFNHLYPATEGWMYGVRSIQSINIHALKMVGDRPEIRRLLPSTLTADELFALRETFVKIHEIVDSHESIPENLKSHLVYLCKRGIDLIDGEDVDLVALRSVCFETSGVGFAASVAFPEDAQGAWFDRLRGLWVWGSKVAAAGAIEYGAHKALEAAGGSF